MRKKKNTDSDIFSLSLKDIKNIIRDFHSEMENGLTGKKSSLKMIPTYVSRPTGNEKGKFIALDLGGTNFRILKLDLEGNGKIGSSDIMKFALSKRHITGSAEIFFGFIADCVKKFLDKYRFDPEEKVPLGFTFSFPVRQKSASSGELVCWTKGFKVRGVIGNDVVELLEKALAEKGVGNINISALANDTVGTLVAKSYEDKNCDVGVIIGTGTNACYPELIEKIVKLPGHGSRAGEMIINIEWGNFNKLKLTPFDRALDKDSDNRGEQILEKMVSGMYLGRITGLVMKERLGLKHDFKSEYISVIEDDNTPGLRRTGSVLKKTGVKKSDLIDRIFARNVCRSVSRRAARLGAACIAAIVTKTDPALARRHTVAIDGSVYEKHPAFKREIRSCLKEIFGAKSARIKIELAKDGSGKGAAIIAAVAAGSR
jgi:hexokinase